MENIRLIVQKYKKIFWLILIGYLVFCGLFNFPLSNKVLPFDLEKFYMTILSSIMSAILFFSLLSNKNNGVVYLVSLLCTSVGMFLRYIIEYGEYSNTVNFTQLNILIYLGMIPFLCTFVYLIIYKLEK